MLSASFAVVYSDVPMFRFITLFVLAIASCARNPTQPTDLASTDDLVRAFEQKSVTVVRGGALSHAAYPFFSVAAQRLVVNGEDVQVFGYPDAGRADNDAARVSPTGTPIDGSQIAWIEAPHFYKRDRLIVLYVGHSPNMLLLLQTVLGQPFAAGR